MQGREKEHVAIERLGAPCRRTLEMISRIAPHGMALQVEFRSPQREQCGRAH